MLPPFVCTELAAVLLSSLHAHWSPVTSHQYSPVVQEQLHLGTSNLTWREANKKLTVTVEDNHCRFGTSLASLLTVRNLAVLNGGLRGRYINLSIALHVYSGWGCTWEEN
ncbi:hypothetical protein RRG08_048561 [Elysia crispata]|uniref:Secreted protein n=1 Tax=Elysia crispata TaxID=231223 RepID=A0AAE1B550_9GAST|nr:hypothetical protein RRG08_048561 [Elysia crispata]